VWVQPVAGLHESFVHELESSQLIVVLTQRPSAGLHESLVHALPSLQESGGLETQVPPSQISPVVQALPSLQSSEFGAFTQPDAGLQLSSVQTSSSSQSGAAPPTHTPKAQASPVVQADPSLQEAVLKSVLSQPVDGLQVSFVQTLPSLQSVGPPPTHEPPEQASPVVQALPSLQEAVLFVCTHPEAGLQLSSVQPLPSSQFGAAPPTQLPPAQVSFVVQALPSSHEAVLFVCTHPEAGLQLSSVQPLVSSQEMVLPTQ
jgi:hypothetical protein